MQPRVTELAVVIATAIPVIAVAFYAMRAATGAESGAASPLPPIPLRPWQASLLRRDGARRFLDTFGNAWVDDSGSLRTRPEWVVGTDRGFMLRAPTGLVLSLVPLISGEDSTLGRLCLAVALVLTVASLNALLTYSTLSSAKELTASSSRARRAATNPETSDGPTIQDGEGDWSVSAESRRFYAADSLFLVQVVGIVTDVVAFVLAVLLVASGD